ncbi:FxsA family protein [Kineococcus terrestris]|uniref:FxsA family protein n=1 Tax=Kineococcus terrestris TaxID=2044856 RepID=UPI0034DACF07
MSTASHPRPGTGTGPRLGRGPRWPRVLPVAVLALLVLEVWLLVQLARVLDGLGVLVVLLGGLLAGLLVLRRAGGRAVRAVRAAAAAGRAAPAAQAERGVGDAVLLGLAGALLVLPGPLSTVAGLLLLLPPVRALVRRSSSAWVQRRVERAVREGSAVVVVDGQVVRGGPGGPGGSGGPGAAGAPAGALRGRVLEGEVLEGEVLEGEVVDPPRRER